MPEIKSIRVVELSSLFNADELELFQDHVNEQWTWGDTAMSLVSIHAVSLAAMELSILNEKFADMDNDIMVDLNH